LRPVISLVALAIPLLVGGALLGGAAQAQGVPAQDSLTLFENLLRNPDEVQTNLAYAQALQAAGNIAEARREYQKVLALSPNNPTAIAALAYLGQALTPAQTDYTLRVGGAYESNSARRDPAFRPFTDELAFGELFVNDLRRIGDLNVQTNLDIFSNIHDRYSPADISYFSVDSGPIWDLGSYGKLRTAVGGEYVLQGASPKTSEHLRRFEFGSGNLILNYFPAGTRHLQSINLLVGYDQFRDAESFRNGPVIRATAPFVFEGLRPFQTTVLATPGYSHDGANQPPGTMVQPGHFDELNLDILSLTPLAENRVWARRVLGKAGVFMAGDFYDSHDFTITHDRRDFRIVPLVGVRLVDFAYPRVQVDLDYRYDRNFSNEFVERYQDHIVSLTLTYRF
jgi:hypothetical protein